MTDYCIEKYNTAKINSSTHRRTRNASPIPGQESDPRSVPTPYYLKVLFSIENDIWAEEDKESPEFGSEVPDMDMIKRRVNSELSEYRSHPRLQRRQISKRFDIGDYSNPLVWWRTRILDYPILSAIAKRFLTVPAVATKENNFTVEGATLSKSREGIDSENGCAVVYVRDNWDISMKLKRNPE